MRDAYPPAKRLAAWHSLRLGAHMPFITDASPATRMPASLSSSLLLALVLILAGLLTMPAALARDAMPLDDDPALEARVMAVAEELRCLVCQNETIAASHADLAVDLRKQIRTQLAQGRSEAQILDYMVARYGEFVRYRPAFNAMTALLWVGPFALLAWALGMWWRRMRQPAPGPTATELNDAEAAHLRQLLGEGANR